MVSIEYKEAMTEVLNILENSEEEIVNKIPKKLIEFFEKNKDTTYKPQLDHTKPIQEMEIKEKTKDIITLIYLKYLCKQNENDQILHIINEKQNQEKIIETYSRDKLFNKKEKQENKYQDSISIIKYKESFFKRILNKIKRFFK